tara:strand:+ start:196 stop:1026 length:831 start_codon:yes stop_codon:yes gene_type:complete
MKSYKPQNINLKENQNSNKKKTNPNKFRQTSYWLYGINSGIAALRNPQRRCYEICCTQEVFNRHKVFLQKYSRNKKIKIQKMSRNLIEKQVGNEARHQGFIILVDPLEEKSLEQIKKTNNNEELIIALDQVNDPRNIGAIMRSAAFFGCSTIILSSHKAPKESAVMAKAASGGLEILGITRVNNLSNALKLLKKDGHWIIGLESNSKKNINTANFNLPITLVLGSEGRGLRRLTRETCDDLVSFITKSQKIERIGLDSLNVASAASIAINTIIKNN